MSEQKTQTTEIYEGRDALRWLLNISSENDKPNSRVSTLMDRTYDANGKSIRERLEKLWEELK